MIIIIAAITGALWGGFLAKRRKGLRADIAQYAVAYAIAFSVVGLFVTIFIDRMT